jgi:hypothetical protein
LAGWKAISGNAKRFGWTIGRAQVFSILAALESHGVIQRAAMFRRGALRRGFTVLPHDSWAQMFPALGVCGFRSDAELRRCEDEASKQRRRRQKEIHRIGTTTGSTRQSPEGIELDRYMSGELHIPDDGVVVEILNGRGSTIQIPEELAVALIRQGRAKIIGVPRVTY